MPVLEPLSGGQSSTATASRVLPPLTTTNKYVQQPLSSKSTPVKTVPLSQPKPPQQNPLESLFPNTINQVKELIKDPFSLHVDLTKTVSDAVNTLVNTFKTEAPKVAQIIQPKLVSNPIGLNTSGVQIIKPPTNTKELGKTLQGVSAGANIVLSPISAVFAGANDFPVLGSLSRAIGVAFSALGEGATDVSNKLVDTLPISKQAKADIKPGLGEIFALAAQLAVPGLLGKKALDLKKADLVKSYGEKDATTIVNKAEELAKTPPKTEYTPQEVIDGVINSGASDTPQGKAYLKQALDAQQKGENVPAPTNKSYVTIVDHKTGTVEAKEIPPKQLDLFKNVIDNTETGIAGKRIGDKTYHITSGTIGESVKRTGEARLEEIPKGNKPSKIGKSIEAKAIEAKLTKGYGETAGYEPITIKDQAQKAADLINNEFNKAREIVLGHEPLPEGLKGTALITAMEEHIKANPNADLAYELANSPLVSATSKSAQELRLAAEREPDSATAKLMEIKKAREDQVKNLETKRNNVKNNIKAETDKINLQKEDLNWNKFLDSIKC